MIKVEHLTKCYGDFMAVNDLSFEIAEGKVYGFLGPNGAGKSTTMNMITGCLSPTAGKISVGGYDILEEPQKAKRLIGYLPEQPPLYLNETPLEYLQFVGEAKGIRGAGLREGIEEVLCQTGITHVKNRLISTLSKGYKQRVGIAQALLGSPKVIILDEPTVGLDPIQIIEIRDLIKKLGETHTVIFSSHILPEVQAICEQVLIISQGRLAAFDTPEKLELLTQAGGIQFAVLAEVESVIDIIREMEHITEYQCTDRADGSTSVRVWPDTEDIRRICCDVFFAFARAGLPIFEMSSKKASLEEVFLDLTEGSSREPETEKTMIREAEVEA